MFFAFFLEVLSLFYIVVAEFLVASTSVDSFRILKLFQIVQISSGFQVCEVCFTFFLFLCMVVGGCWLSVVGGCVGSLCFFSSSSYFRLISCFRLF